MTTQHYPKNRFTPENSAILLVDHQTGLLLGVQDLDQDMVRRNAATLARTAKMFDMPVLLTTSAEDGPNGPLIPQVTNELPSVKVIQRTGEIDAFDYAEFADAVHATGRKNLIIAGISTDVCLTFAALSAVDRGYNVHAVIDASGTWNNAAQATSIARMSAAGVTMNSTVGVTAELQRDWKNPTGEALATLYADLAIPFYQTLIALRS
ncbi:isochorismatase family protein [Psychromonas arctica]|uniref:isochorismatase family protein n=1 Tax=Psychromonas arctica TaxID=168275 RepID=UPI002FD0AB20